MSTWGDSYYIGLNGLELCDSTGKSIPLSPHSKELVYHQSQKHSASITELLSHYCVCMPRPLPSDVAAYPDSVNVLSDVSGDIRTPDKLVDGVNDTYDGRHMWLAPILPHTVSHTSVAVELCLQRERGLNPT